MDPNIQPQQVQQQQEVPIVPQQKSRINVFMLIVIVVVILAGGIYAYLAFFAKKPAVVQAPVQYATVPVYPFKSVGKGILSYLVSYNSRYEQKTVNLQTGAIQSSSELPSGSPGNPPDIVISPDRKMFIYKKDKDLYLVNRVTREASVLISDRTDSGIEKTYGVFDFSWSPDGKHVLLSVSEADNAKPWDSWAEFVLLNLATKQISTIQDPQGPGWKHYCGVGPRWSPDSTKLLFFDPVSTLQCSTPGLYIINVDRAVITPLNSFIPKAKNEQLPSISAAVWSWDGKHIYFQREVSQGKFVNSIIDPDGAKFDNVATLSNLSFESQWITENEILYVDDSGIWEQNVDNGEKDLLIADDQHILGQIALSPDKKYLFYQTALKSPQPPLQIDENPNSKTHSIKWSVVNLQTREGTDLDAGTGGFTYEDFTE